MTKGIEFNFMKGMTLMCAIVLGTMVGCSSPDAKPVRATAQAPGAGVSPYVPPPPPKPSTPPQAFLPKPK